LHRQYSYNSEYTRKYFTLLASVGRPVFIINYIYLLQLNGTKHYLENPHVFFFNNYCHIRTDGVPLNTPSSEDRTGLRLELLMAGNYKCERGWPL